MCGGYVAADLVALVAVVLEEFAKHIGKLKFAIATAECEAGRQCDCGPLSALFTRSND